MTVTYLKRAAKALETEAGATGKVASDMLNTIVSGREHAVRDEGHKPLPTCMSGARHLPRWSLSRWPHDPAEMAIDRLNKY